MSTLLSDFSLGSLTLKNRVCMAPMTRSMSPNNVPNDKVVDYYRRRAAGGVGLIITEGTIIGHKAASGYPDVPAIYGDDALAGWRKVVEAVHEQGGKIAPQLWHVGGIRKPGMQPGGELPGYSPSGMAFPAKVTGHAMTLDDIEEVIESYVQAAVNAVELGFDALEIHAAHGYLIDQFFWQATNQRDDQYGGSMANRGRFAVQIISAMRAKIPADFPIILRFSQWKQQDYNARLATTPEQLGEFLAPLVDAGVDAFHCSTRRFWQAEFDGSDLNLAAWTKKLTGCPTIAVGSVSLANDFIPEKGETVFKGSEIASIDQLHTSLDNQEYDLVAIGRALLANPDWVNKVQAGQFSDLVAFDKEMLSNYY